MVVGTFGGDEVGAVVLDIGSSNTRVGHAGEDSPRAVIPSAVGSLQDAAARTKFAGEAQVFSWRENMEILSPLENGVVRDWDALECLWDYSVRQRLRSNHEEHPMLMVEPAYNPRETREKLIEMAFEKFNAPAFYLGRSPLHSFASGKSTAVVLESGSDVTTAVPVFDGFILKKGIRKEALAGNAVSIFAQKMLEASNVKVLPHYMIARKLAVDAGTPANARVLTEFKETVCHVSDYPYSEELAAGRPAKSFEFPDGYNNVFGAERFKIPEILFNPSIVGFPQFDSADFVFKAHLSEPFIGAPQLIQSAISSCDVDIRYQLGLNVVLSGGNTQFNGYADRMMNSLATNTLGIKFRVHASNSSTERKYGPWIGGSILASLGTFHQMWISKKEYEEKGVSVEKRIP
ncbi:Actin-like 6A [Dinochytrium kinnereticum]|nr:Actin-like 6A [Dinochytrium kinnereticum]